MTATLLRPRPYQVEAIDAVETAWAKGVTRPAVVLPTGSGKTVIFAHLAEREHVRGEGVTLVLVHRDELVRQTVDKLHSVAAHLRVGIVKAERDEHSQLDYDVIVASVQTLSRPNRRRWLNASYVSLVIVDECHHAAADSYWAILRTAGCFGYADAHIDPVRAVGFTATMHRDDDRGLGDVWQDIVYRRDIPYFIIRGYLSNVAGRAVHVDGLDLACLAKTRGDYKEGELGRALTSCGAAEVVAKSYAEHALDRQGIVFAPTVETAYAIASELHGVDIAAEVIESRTPIEDRQRIYQAYRDGEVRVLCNNLVLTEGFDMPQASCAVIARPTTNPALYVQMVGRVLRPAPGKDDALILDVVGVASRFSLASLASLSTTGVQPLDGELLTDAIVRREEEIVEELGPDIAPAGELSHTDIDLFHKSSSMWLRTRGGHWFIPTKDRLYLIWPRYRDGRDGLFMVGWVPSGGGKGHKVHDELTMEYALGWAEQEAEEHDPSIARRAASWRVRKARPSDAQRGMARRLGLSAPDDMTKAQLSDVISVELATRQLDKY